MSFRTRTLRDKEKLLKTVMRDWLTDTVMPWPDEHGPWEVALHWAAGESGVICTGFDLRTQEGKEPEAVTASRLRELRLHELVQEGRRRKYAEAGGDLVAAYDAAVAAGEDEDFNLSLGLIESIRRESGDWTEPQRPGRLTDEHFRQVAVVYSTALDAGRNPLRAVMEHPAWGPTSKPTASRWVARARSDNHLPPTGRGRARGNAELVPSAGGQS